MKILKSQMFLGVNVILPQDLTERIIRLKAGKLLVS